MSPSNLPSSNARPGSRKATALRAAKPSKAKTPSDGSPAAKIRKATSSTAKSQPQKTPHGAKTIKPGSTSRSTADNASGKTPRSSAKPRNAGTRKRAVAPTDIVESLRIVVTKALDDLKARDIVEIDVRGKTSVADYLFVASGTSSRHVRSIADEVVKLAKQAGMRPLGVEGQREAEWVLVDLGDIVVHVMLPRSREFYSLERLWTVGDDMPAASAAH